MSAPVVSLSPEVDLKIVGQITSAIAVLHIFPSEAELANFLVPLLKGVPGCQSTSLCFRKIAHPLGDVQGSPCLPCAQGLDRRVESGPYRCGLLEPGTVRAYPLETTGGFYGYFVLKVDEKGDFDKYEPFVRNLAYALAILARAGCLCHWGNLLRGAFGGLRPHDHPQHRCSDQELLCLLRNPRPRRFLKRYAGAFPAERR